MHQLSKQRLVPLQQTRKRPWLLETMVWNPRLTTISCFVTCCGKCLVWVWHSKFTTDPGEVLVGHAKRLSVVERCNCKLARQMTAKCTFHCAGFLLAALLPFL